MAMSILDISTKEKPPGTSRGPCHQEGPLMTDEIVAASTDRWGMDPAENRARHARQAAFLRGLIADGKLSAGQCDNQGNSVEAVIRALERASR